MDDLETVALPTILTVPDRVGVMSWSFSAWMRAWLADMLLSRSILASELRGRLFGGSGEASLAKDVLETFDSRRVLASDVVDVLAAMLSTSLWNLRLVVASAGCVVAMVMCDAVSPLWYRGGGSGLMVRCEGCFTCEQACSLLVLTFVYLFVAVKVACKHTADVSSPNRLS